jgi:HEAT repeat protein
MKPAKTPLLLSFLAVALALSTQACDASPSPSKAAPTLGSLGVSLPRGALPRQPAAASAPSAAVSRADEIARLLDGYEDTPSKGALLEHGGEAEVIGALAALAQDGAQPTIRRLRAVSLLGLFPSDRTRQALESALAGPDLFRREAVTAYASAFGEAALPRLTALLGHEDQFTRIVTVQALGRIGTPQALSAIEARVKIEPLETVRGAAGRELAKAAH